MFLAQRWASQCANGSEKYSYRRIPGIWDYVGQNFYEDATTTTTANFTKAFSKWMAQKDVFTYGK